MRHMTRASSGARGGILLSNKHKVIMNVYRLKTPIEEVIDSLKARGYSEVPCNRDKYLLFLAGVVTKPKWGPFLNEIAREPQGFQNLYASFVLMRTSTDSATYAVTGGLGTLHIGPFVDPDFGLDVLSRLIDPDKIKSIRQQAISGNVLQEEFVYKRTHPYFTDPLGWLKLPRQIMGEIDKADFSQALGLERNDRRPIHIESKRGFLVRRSLSFDELDTLFNRLDVIEGQLPRLELLKGCEEVPSSRRKQLDERLAQHISMLFHRYLENPVEFTDSSVFLASDDAHRWLLCTRFEASMGSKKHESFQMELNDLFAAFQDWEMTTLPDLSKVKISGYDEEGAELIQGKLTDFLMAEIICDNQSYILIDRRWFRIRSSFSEHLDEIIKRFLSTEQNYSLGPWPMNSRGLVTEDQYIDSVAQSNKHLVKFHKDHVSTKSGKAEICDIFDARGQQFRLVFVKRGITSKSRELSRQAVDSVLLLLADNEFREKAIQKLREKGISLPPDFSFGKCGVVLAVVDEKDRASTGLLERLPVISKIEFAFALQTLYSRTDGLVNIYEIPKRHATPTKS